MLEVMSEIQPRVRDREGWRTRKATLEKLVIVTQSLESSHASVRIENIVANHEK